MFLAPLSQPIHPPHVDTVDKLVISVVVEVDLFDTPSVTIPYPRHVPIPSKPIMAGIEYRE
jgi:hypothetical protein